MRLGEIRERLMKQHVEVRAAAARARGACAAVRDGAADARAAWRAAVRDLQAAVLAHIEDEERLLAGVIVTVDAWGPQRKVLMDVRHAAEHDALRTALRTATETTDLVAAAARVDGLVVEMLADMDREEREILHPNVLRDDCFAADPFGG